MIAFTSRRIFISLAFSARRLGCIFNTLMPVFLSFSWEFYIKELFHLGTWVWHFGCPSALDREIRRPLVNSKEPLEVACVIFVQYPLLSVSPASYQGGETCGNGPPQYIMGHQWEHTGLYSATELRSRKEWKRLKPAYTLRVCRLHFESLDQSALHWWN